MGLLDNFERGLERAVNGAFAKTFRSGVQPVEISSALRRELDTKAAVVSRERILVPNEFTVRLAPPDCTRMNDVGRPLIDELTQMVHQHAVAQNYSFSGPVTIRLQQDGTLSTGILQVDSTTVQRDVAWVAVLDIGSQRHRLQRGRTVIGRGSDADITIADTGTSRKHVEVAVGRQARPGHRSRLHERLEAERSALPAGDRGAGLHHRDRSYPYGVPGDPGERRRCSMTTGLTLLVLRFAFLAVLWLFVFVIVFALRSDLFGQRVRTIPTDPKSAPVRPDDPHRAGCGGRRPRPRAVRSPTLIGQPGRLAASRLAGRDPPGHHRGCARGHGDAARWRPHHDRTVQRVATS